MNMDDVTVIGGKVIQGMMNKKTFESDRKQFEVYKILQWLYMISNKEKPEKWYKPSSKGTAITFSLFRDGDEVMKEIDKFVEHCRAIGEMYDIEKLDIFTQCIITIKDKSLKKINEQNNTK